MAITPDPDWLARERAWMSLDEDKQRRWFEQQALDSHPADLDAQARLGMLADLCPHGSGACGCGDEPRTCSRPDRAGPVWRPTCLECVQVPYAG